MDPINTDLSAVFDPVAGSAAAARRFLRHELEQLAVPEPPMETTILLTNELVSNGIRHARTAVELRLRATPASVRVEVHDGDTSVPAPPAATAGATSGRGLLMVQALASSWGIDGRADGKVVWFELPIPGIA